MTAPSRGLSWPCWKYSVHMHIHPCSPYCSVLELRVGREARGWCSQLGRDSFSLTTLCWVCLEAWRIGLKFPELFHPPYLQTAPGYLLFVITVPRNNSKGDAHDVLAKCSLCISSFHAHGNLLYRKENRLGEVRPCPRGHRASR